MAIPRFTNGHPVDTATVPTVKVKRTNGRVKYSACKLATTSGGKTCDKKKCLHTIRDYVWVEWTDGKVLSYHESELISQHTSVVRETQSSAQNTKAAIIEKFATIEKSVAPVKNEIDWGKYNGYSRLRAAKRDDVPLQQVPLEDIDWNVYHGLKRGSSVRKSLNNK